ncbi:hypothetical protein [Pantoea agglomerans]|uniref:Uncharacterized protein n=1 Tax=Enterobacter agglomerans TaxID=549 RepID=A0A379AJ87_ENTAG|nr:hypothetical protein [Pantoea agglomerans]MBD8144292.1 hypothetical protein [Pantoea agglomerans]QXB58168.1 hypothetical protein I6L77_16285 [Pantoea agglomerans]WVL79232.1 hypothetical protein IFT78_014170 [Pantoea agglomerans]SUB17984.1 Uncharacterised protein [Pantoea agglomerans]
MAKKGNRNIPRDTINKESLVNSDSSYVTDLEKKIFDFPSIKRDGLREKIIDKKPYVILKYFQDDWECFSDWKKEELKQFSTFVKKLSNYTWGNIYETGGKVGNKTGFGYTKYHLSEMKSGKETIKKVQSLIDPELAFFELRINDKLRVHGFQSQSAFFLVMLDREHRVFP